MFNANSSPTDQKNIGIATVVVPIRFWQLRILVFQPLSIDSEKMNRYGWHGSFIMIFNKYIYVNKIEMNDQTELGKPQKNVAQPYPVLWISCLLLSTAGLNIFQLRKAVKKEKEKKCFVFKGQNDIPKINFYIILEKIWIQTLMV